VHERVRHEPIPDEPEHRDVAQRSEVAQRSQEKLTTADMAIPNRPVDQLSPAQPAEARGAQLHAVPPPSAVSGGSRRVRTSLSTSNDVGQSRVVIQEQHQAGPLMEVMGEGPLPKQLPRVGHKLGGEGRSIPRGRTGHGNNCATEHLAHVGDTIFRTD
jgi:hypothetical protein